MGEKIYNATIIDCGNIAGIAVICNFIILYFINKFIKIIIFFYKKIAYCLYIINSFHQDCI
jgi:hypothetical protein